MCPTTPPLPTLVRWGNYDTVTGAIDWNTGPLNGDGLGEAVPKAYTYIAANTLPGSHTLPASSHYSSKPSFWTSPPWPPIGPDVSGGAGPGGHANNIPAAACYYGPMGGPTNGSGSVLTFDAYLPTGSGGCAYGTGSSGTPSISFSPTSYNYGTVTVGTPPSCPTNCVTITMSNPGTATLTWTGLITTTDSTDYAFISNACSGNALVAGASCNITIQFQPQSAGAHNTTMNVNGTNISGMSYTVPLSGTGSSVMAPIVSLSTSTLAFGPIAPLGTAMHTVTLTNTGNAGLVMTSTAVSGSGLYTIMSNTCTGTVAAMGTALQRYSFRQRLSG